MTKDSLHHAGKNGEIHMEKTCIMLVRMGSIPVWRISMVIISTHITSKSLVVPIRAYKRLNIFAILSIASFLLDLNISIPVWRFPMETAQRDTSSRTYTCTTLMHSTNMYRQYSTMDSASQKLTWMISKENQQNRDPASWKLIRKKNSSLTTHQVDACSCKLTGEENSESTI